MAAPRGPFPHAHDPPFAAARRCRVRRAARVRAAAGRRARRPRPRDRSGGGGGRARHLVGQRPEPQPRHRGARAQRLALSGRDRRRPLHADLRPRRHRDPAAGRRLGLAPHAGAPAGATAPAPGALDHRLRGRDRGRERPAADRALAPADRARRRRRRRAPRRFAGRPRPLERAELRRDRLRLRRRRHPLAHGRLRLRRRRATGRCRRRTSEPDPPQDDADDAARDEEPGWGIVSSAARPWPHEPEGGAATTQRGVARRARRGSRARPRPRQPFRPARRGALVRGADGGDGPSGGGLRARAVRVAPAAAPKPEATCPAPTTRSTKATTSRILPPLTLLSEPKKSAASTVSTDALEQNATLLESTLEDFGVRGEIINVRPGPVVTLYELEPAPGTKSSRVISLADDIARSMSAVSARVAVVQGRNAIGIELPNQKRETVYLRELLASQDFEGSKHKLALCLGKTIGGEPVIVDLARMPHLLVAGTTGSGKSVAINTMILSLLYRLTPEECRLIMVDPKMLELSVYDGIPHLLTPVVTDPKKAVVALKWAVREMEDRYKKMSKVGVRNIDGFNAARRRGRGEGRGHHPHGADRLRPRDRRGDLRGRGHGPRAAALHRRHRRRDGRPDDGRRQGHRGRHPAPGPDGARRRHPPHHRDAAPVGRRDHRHHQGELPDPHLLPGHLQDRFAAPSSARRAPSSCSARATCSTWPAAAASPACTARSCPTTRSRRWWRISRRQGRPSYLDAVTADEDEERRLPPAADTPVFDKGEFGPRRRPLRPGGRGRAARQEGLDLLHPAPPADRLQPRRLADRADGEGRASSGRPTTPASARSCSRPRMADARRT